MRNRSLDIIKLVAAFLVVCIHYAPKNNLFDAYFNAICRVAVPLFFIITGYYYDSLKESKKLLPFIKKIVVLTLGASIFYFLLYVIQYSISGDLMQWLSTVFSIKSIGIWIILNSCPVAGHLWYLYALIYALIINLLVDRLKLLHKFFYIVPFLLLLHVTLNYYVHYLFVRNWLLLGVPFLVIGRWLHYNVKRIKERITHRVALYLLLASLILLLFETIVLLKINPYRDLYMFNVPIVIIIATYAISNPNWPDNKIMANIGKAHSTNIYIYHVLFGNLFIAFIHPFNSHVFEYLMPIIIFCMSLVFSILLKYIRFFSIR